MKPQLPPPDPHESREPREPESARALPWPTAVFTGGEPEPDAERAADAILALRPGLLVVCAGR